MKIIQITPGSGDNFYCENCLRDQALVRALNSKGHDITMVPLYLPIKLDSPESRVDAPIFYGGINVYLQQKLGLFRKTPRWVDSMFDNRKLLSGVSKKAGMTSSKELGETTISMLRGEQGYQVKELDRLVEYLSGEISSPDVIVLSNVLLGGLAPSLRQRIQVPVICLLQDEEAFVDGLGEPYTGEAWRLLKNCSKEINAFISVSKTYAERIAPKLDLDDRKLHTVYMGIDLKEYHAAESPPAVPTIGFLSRMCRERGLDTLTDAFIRIRENPELKDCRLEISGGKNLADEPFISEIKQKLEAAGAADDVLFLPEFLGGGRKEWLKSLSVMCVPEKEEAAYGLFALEAKAAGVPVVVPKTGIFPEMMELTGGGILVEYNSPVFFAEVLTGLLLDPQSAHELGKRGRTGIEEHFDIEKTSDNLIRVFDRIIREA